MSDLEDRFRDAGRIPVPDLWNDASSRAPGPMPGGGTARRIGAAAVAIAVAASGIALARGLATDEPASTFGTGSSRPGGPMAGPSVSPTHEPPTPIPARFEFVRTVVVSATANRLIVDDRFGRVRWTVDQGCDVDSYWLVGERHEGETTSGETSGSCGEESTSLEVGAVGSLREADGHYGFAAGRALSEPGYRVRATLGDGRTTVVTPLNGLWLIVTEQAPGAGSLRPDRDSVVTRVELLDPDGRVVATQDLPANSY